MPARSVESRATQPPSEPFALELGKLAQLRARALLGPFVAGFAISVTAAVIVEVAGPAFGGMFLALPAIPLAAATRLERRHGLAQATAEVRGATAGALGTFAFAWVAWLLLPRIAAVPALAVAMLAWLAASAAVYGVMHQLVRTLGEHHYLPEIPTLEAAEVLEALRVRSLTVATAESCTGGLLAAYFTSVPGAAELFRGSIIAYNSEVKATNLGISRALLANEGAVCAGVAAGMARHVRLEMGADIGVGTTGLTGKPQEGKPAGLTFVAVALPTGATWIRRYTDDFGPGRNDERAVRMSFRLVRDALEGRPDRDHDVSIEGTPLTGRR